MIRVDEAQEDPPLLRPVHELVRPAGRVHQQGVEVPVVDQRPSLRLERGGKGRRPTVHPAGDRPEAVGAVVHRVHGGENGREHLRGADVGRRLVPPDVLLADLQRQPVGGPPFDVDRHPDEPTGQAALEPGPDGHETGMGTAEAEWDTEALARSDHDVGAPLTGRGQEGERQEVGGHGHQAAPCVHRGGHRGEVADGAGAAGVLQDDADEVLVGQPIC